MAGASGRSLRTQVLALVTASLFIAMGLAIAILVAMPPPRPAPISLLEVASALKGGPLVTAHGSTLLRTHVHPGRLVQARASPQVLDQRDALAALVAAPPARVVLNYAPEPVRLLTHGIDIHGPGPPRRPPPYPLWRPGAPNDEPLFDGFVAALADADGDMVVVRPAPAPFPTPWQLAIASWLVGSGVLLVPPAVWLAARVTAPLDAFARAAEQLGRNPGAPPLAPSGPAELRRATAAFNEMQVRVSRYVEDRTGMIGAISHDMRTPLARLRFKLESQRMDRRAIASDLDQLEGMIAQVLTFLRDAQEPSERERIDLLSLVETAVEEWIDGGASVRLVREADGTVEGEVGALRRLLGNLIENAVKYGGRADVSVFAGPKELRVEVEDDGPGLPPQERAAVFRPFYRTEAARTLDRGGVGLGLALSRSVARAHGGDVTLDVRGRGLVAILTLPALAPSPGA